jgi:hydroxypyruvate reductase
VLVRYGIECPKSVAAILGDPRSETPKPGDPRFERVENVIVATAKDALNAAARKSEEFGLPAILLGHDIEGRARDVAQSHAEHVQAILNQDEKGNCVLLSGGEVTVALEGSGRGGPNTEFLLALALALEPADNVWALACDTDGIDGSGDNAGAFLSPEILTRAHSRGLDPRDFLARNDSYRFFDALDALVRTGPTRTNVNDFRAILIG